MSTYLFLPILRLIGADILCGTRRAPPHILNVRSGEPVELRVAKRLNEEYVAPPKGPASAFSGSGNRLGAPVPEVTGSSSGAPGSSSAMPGGFPSAVAAAASASSTAGSGAERQSLSTRFEVDQSKPTTSVQIRLADGTRSVLFNGSLFILQRLMLRIVQIGMQDESFAHRRRHQELH